MKDIIKKLLKETLVVEFYGKRVIEPITKRFNDSSDDMINKLAIAFLFRSFFGDIMQYQTKEQFEQTFNKWYEGVLGEMIKTKDFPDNKPLAKKYLDAYINNIVSLGDAARPFSFKDLEKTLVDLINNNRWIPDEEVSVGPSMYKPDQEDIMYEDDEVLILNTDTKAKCVRYGMGETWCITKADQNYYNTYRLSYGATPYFVLQKNVNGDEHKLVILNYGGRDAYAIADRSNTGERSGSQRDAMSWSEIEQQLPNLKGLEEYFPYREISDDERKYSELLDNIKANYSKEHDYGFGDSDDNLQKVIDRYSNNLVINGAKITSSDFIRDLAANQMSFTLDDLKSFRKETMDSLIESGYFVNLYYDTKLYEEVLSPSQIKRIIKLKIDSNKVLDDVFYQFMTPDAIKKYMVLRINGHNNGSQNKWSTNINEKELNFDELMIIKDIFPDVKINTDRYNLEDGYDLFKALYSDPSIITKAEVKENLNKLTKHTISMLIKRYPELTKYLVRLDGFDSLGLWEISNMLEDNPKNYKVILNSLSKEKKAELLERLQHTTLLPLLIRDKYISIDNEEEYKKLRYTLIYDTKGKAFVYIPDLLRFVDASYDLGKILMQQPILFKYLGDRINSINDYDLKDIIQKNPKSLNYIPDERIDAMGEYRIYSMVYAKPILARQLYNKIGMNYMVDLIKYVPKVIQYLPDSVFKQLDKYDMVSILYKKELYPYMEPIIDKYMPDDKDYILDRI